MTIFYIRNDIELLNTARATSGYDSPSLQQRPDTRKRYVRNNVNLSKALCSARSIIRYDPCSNNGARNNILMVRNDGRLRQIVRNIHETTLTVRLPVYFTATWHRILRNVRNDVKLLEYLHHGTCYYRYDDLTPPQRGTQPACKSAMTLN